MKKALFLIFEIIFILIFGLFSFLLVNYIKLYSTYSIEHDDLQYEELTFVKYEYIDRHKSTNLYEIYFLEYDKPFEITGIVEKRLDKITLNNLKPNDICYIYYRENNNKKYDYEICEFQQNNIFILTLDNYIEMNQNNQILGVVVFSFLALNSIFLIVLLYIISKYEKKLVNNVTTNEILGKLKIEYIIDDNVIQVYNSPSVCSLVINGEIIDKYIGVVASKFTLTGQIEVNDNIITVEAKMGNFYMTLYYDDKAVAKVFMALG